MGMTWSAVRCDPAKVSGTVELMRSGELKEDESTFSDVDKSWHGIHWLLTGSAEPTDADVSAAIMGPEPLNDAEEDGTACLLAAPDRVQAVAAALEGITPADLKKRMDPEAMEEAELYPAIWNDLDVFDTYLGSYYEILREFYLAAAADQQAVIQRVI